ncbi:hypothetical protein [Tumebacillus algifaecis]|uniref:hypothetical protein n=1 Tax=Tumebacillus algifaecis TaxID=1214604 RepID=UPI0012FD6CBC|nr:hypothetical protein [Tumebacillus algifaecis]
MKTHELAEILDHFARILRKMPDMPVVTALRNLELLVDSDKVAQDAFEVDSPA